LDNNNNSIQTSNITKLTHKIANVRGEKGIVAKSNRKMDEEKNKYINNSYSIDEMEKIQTVKNSFWKLTWTAVHDVLTISMIL
jgi:hypothetical protein